MGFKCFTRPAKIIEDAALNGDTNLIGEPLEIIGSLTTQLELEQELIDKASMPDMQKAIADQSQVLASISSSEEAVDSDDTDLRSPITSSLPLHNPKFAQIVVDFNEKLKVNLGLLDDHIKKSEFEDITFLAHWLKGSGGNVGFKQFTKPAATMESAAKEGDMEVIREFYEVVTSIAKRIVVPEGNATPASDPGIDVSSFKRRA